uniref:Uncharacterized protein n=1 Tax=Cucumis melo TaxID=3656 RepID=A0A9I9DWH9_CUCME
MTHNKKRLDQKTTGKRSDLRSETKGLGTGARRSTIETQPTTTALVCAAWMCNGLRTEGLASTTWICQ